MSIIGVLQECFFIHLIWKIPCLHSIPKSVPYITYCQPSFITWWGNELESPCLQGHCRSKWVCLFFICREWCINSDSDGKFWLAMGRCSQLAVEPLCLLVGAIRIGCSFTSHAVLRYCMWYILCDELKYLSQMLTPCVNWRPSHFFFVS